MSDDIDVLRKRVQDLGRELKEAQAALKAAEIDRAEFQVGDVVEARLGGGWHVAVIRQVEPMSWGRPWYKVARRTKSGGWSKQVVHAYSEVRAASPPSGGPSDTPEAT